MEYEDITHKIIGSAYKVYNQLGPPASPARLTPLGWRAGLSEPLN